MMAALEGRGSGFGLLVTWPRRRRVAMAFFAEAADVREGCGAIFALFHFYAREVRVYFRGIT